MYKYRDNTCICITTVASSYLSKSWAQRSFPVPAFLLAGSPRGLRTCLASLQQGSAGKKGGIHVRAIIASGPHSFMWFLNAVLILKQVLHVSHTEDT